MEIQRINPDALATPLAAYSQVVRWGNTVTTAGLISTNADGQVVGEGDVEAQTRQTLENVKNALEAAGASLKDVVKTTVYLSDVSNYRAMNAVYNEYFGEIKAAKVNGRRTDGPAVAAGRDRSYSGPGRGLVRCIAGPFDNSVCLKRRAVHGERVEP